MKQKGFTLIELLVTMGIIAVLIGMAAFNFNQSRMRARDVQRKSDLGQLMKAFELYKIDNNNYPPEASNFQAPLLTGSYIKESFVDPKGAEWAYEYSTADQKTYYLMACLENRADSTRAALASCTIFSGSCTCGPNNVGVMYIVTNQ